MKSLNNVHVKTPTGLMLVTQSNLFIEGIRRLLESEKDLQIVAEASAHQDIIPLIKQKRPDILFVDLSLPYLDVLKLLEPITEKSPETKVLLLLNTLDEEFIVSALSCGIRGYLKPSASAEQFVQAIRAMSRGEIWAERRIITRALDITLQRGKLRPVLKHNLTDREEGIIKLVIQGCGNEQIAEKLFISENTVKTHLGHIYDKLGIKNRQQLIVKLLGDDISKT